MPVTTRRLQQILAESALWVGDDDLPRRLQEGDEQALAQFEALMEWWESWVGQEIREYLPRLLEELPSAEPWSVLSATPSQFNRALEAALGDIRSCMKIIYKIPTNRPASASNAERDAELLKLKLENPEWSFDAVAADYNQRHPGANLLRQTAQRAYSNRVKQRRERLQRLAGLAQESLSSQPAPQSDEDGWITLWSADDDPDSGIRKVLELWRTAVPGSF